MAAAFAEGKSPPGAERRNGQNLAGRERCRGHLCEVGRDGIPEDREGGERSAMTRTCGSEIVTLIITYADMVS